MDLIQFHGMEIQATCKDGVPYANLRRLCEFLNLGYQSQLNRLKRSHWACVFMMDTHDSSGRCQEMVFVSADTIPMWLATVDERRVKEDIQAALRAIQSEMRDVLYRHFQGGGITLNGRTLEDAFQSIEALERQIVAIASQMAATHQSIEKLAGQLVPAIQRIEDRTKGKREEITHQVKKRHIETVKTRYRGLCPCCQNREIVDGNGKRIADIAQFDHFYHRSMNKMEHVWLVCKTCNRKLRDRKPNGFWFNAMRAFTRLQECVFDEPLPLFPE